ncbi:MAG: DUF2269 family protein [Gaiellaceae bacterium]
MRTYDWLLFLHVLAAFLFLGGGLVYHVVHAVALRKERPSEVAALLDVGRIGILALQVASPLTLVFGIWLAYANTPDYGIFDEWIVAAIVLWVVSVALGIRGGKTYQEAHKLALKLSGEGDAPSTQLKDLVADRRALVLTYASTVALLVVLVLMVWKPGAY